MLSERSSIERQKGKKRVSLKGIAYAALFLAVLAAIPIGGLMWDSYKWRKFYDPAGKVSDMRSFVQHFGQPERMYRVLHKGKSYYLLFPEDRRKWYSGHPAYLFDLRAQLVDWTPDDGDVPFRVSGYGSYKIDRAIPDTGAELERLMGKQQPSRR